MPGMPEMMSLLPGSASAPYELIWGPMGGCTLACFVDVSAENRVNVFIDAATLETFLHVFEDMLPAVLVIFFPAWIPYTYFRRAILRFLEVTRDIGNHLPVALPVEGDYPTTWIWEHFYPALPNALTDTKPI